MTDTPTREAVAALEGVTPAPDAQAVREAALTYRDGWRFAYRQFQHTGSVPNPDYVPPNSEEAALIAAPAKGGA